MRLFIAILLASMSGCSGAHEAPPEFIPGPFAISEDGDCSQYSIWFTPESTFVRNGDVSSATIIAQSSFRGHSSNERFLPGTEAQADFFILESRSSENTPYYLILVEHFFHDDELYPSQYFLFNYHSNSANNPNDLLDFTSSTPSIAAMILRPCAQPNVAPQS